MMTCRTCLADCEAGVSKNLYDELSENPDSLECIADILTEVTHIQPIKNDNFSETICSGCYVELCNARSFIRKVHASDCRMRNISHLVSNVTENHPESINSETDKIYDDKSVDAAFEDCTKTSDVEFAGIDVNLEISNVTSLNESNQDFEARQFNKPEELQFSFEHGLNVSTALDTDVHVKEEMPDDFEIKQEPYSDDGASIEDLEYYGDGNVLILEDEIKTEPMAVNMDSLEESGRDENTPPRFNVAMPYLNGYGDDEDIKPTEDDLKAYSSNMIVVKTLDEESSDLKCEQCSMVLTSKYAKYRHMKLHKAVLTHCILCSEVFKTRKTLKKHVIKSHSYGELPTCEECNAIFNSFEELTVHSSVHLPIRPDLKCIVCSQADFRSPKNLKAHLYGHREVPMVMELICHPCNKIFLNKFTLKAHRKNNCPANNKLKRLTTSSNANGKRMADVKMGKQLCKKGKLRCLLCPKTFMYEYARTIHMEQHQIRKFQCNICRYKFKRKEELIRHMANSHGEEDDEDY